MAEDKKISPFVLLFQKYIPIFAVLIKQNDILK